MNGGEKDEMLAVLGEIFIGTGLANEGTGTVIDNGQSAKMGVNAFLLMVHGKSGLKIAGNMMAVVGL